MRRFACLLLLAIGCASNEATPTGDAATDASSVSDAGDAGTDSGLSPSALSVPTFLALPLVDAGAGASMASLAVTNAGAVDVPFTGVLTGDARLHLASPPTSVAASATVMLSVSFDGAASPSVATGTLTITTALGSTDVPVYALVGAPSLPTATWSPVVASDGSPCGEGTTIALPTAPFPDPSAAYTDASVRIFVPEGYRDRGAQDVVLHFHGHNTTLASTLAGHRYEQHVCASGVNAVLVLPQGPVNAASGNFGKLMTPSKTVLFLAQVLEVLYRDGRIHAPVLDSVTLTSHSGGYQAVALNVASSAVPTRQVNLFDSLYGYSSTYQAFAESGRPFRSDYTSGGGTLANNQSLAQTLIGSGVNVSETATLVALRDAESVIDFAPSTHDGSTRYRNAYGDRLRFAFDHHRRGARIELRSATASAGMATVRWLAPDDADRTGFVVEASTDGVAFATVATVGVGASSATFSMTGTRSVRVRSTLSVAFAGATQVSDTYVVTDGASTLVVDAFERVLGGSYSGLAHDFAARVGRHVGASSVSARALTEDAFDLTGYSRIVWLAGDQSVDDLPIDPDARARLSTFLAGGGKLLVSGSEVAYALSGDALLTSMGAAYSADDAGSLSASGVGALASYGTLGFGGASAPYPEEYPDVLTPTNGGVTVLQYGTGGAAAVGIAGKAVLVGFPLEVVDDGARRDALLDALLAFLN